MIRNYKQYRYKQRQINRWSALRNKSKSIAASFEAEGNETLWLQIDQFINAMSDEIEVYDLVSRNCSSRDLETLRQIAQIPTALMNARIATGWSLSDIARLTGIDTQRMQRLERAMYAPLKLSEAAIIASVLLEKLDSASAKAPD